MTINLTGENMKKSILVSLAMVFSALPAFAQDGGAGEKGYYALAAGLLLGVAALGGALAQGKIGSSAMEGIARNPQASGPMFTPMILGLVFIETLVLFSFAVAFLIQGNIAG